MSQSAEEMEDAPLLTRGATTMLGELLEARDLEALEDFLERRIDGVVQVSARDLAMMRQLLRYLYRAICDPTDASWERLRLSWSAACADARDELEAFLSPAQPPGDGGVGADSAHDAVDSRALLDHDRGATGGPSKAAEPALANPAPAAPLVVPRHAPSPLAAPPAPAMVAPVPPGESDPFAGSVDETSALDFAAISAAVLPFSDGNSSLPSLAADSKFETSTGGETAEVNLAILAEATTPFAAPGGRVDAVHDELTNEQYASLCAERLHAGQGGRGTVDARYGLKSAADAQKLDAAWRQRLAADPALQERHQRLVERYQEWLRTRG